MSLLLPSEHSMYRADYVRKLIARLRVESRDGVEHGGRTRRRRVFATRDSNSQPRIDGWDVARLHYREACPR